MHFEWGFETTGTVALSPGGREMGGQRDSMRTIRSSEATMEPDAGTDFKQAGARVVSTVRNDAVIPKMVVCHDESGGLL